MNLADTKVFLKLIEGNITMTPKPRHYSRYKAYKDTRIGWLGIVPAHWEVRRLKYSVDLINQKIDGSESDLPYTGLENIESWTGKRIATNGEAHCEGQANTFRQGDVLFGKLRPYLAKVYAPDNNGICTGELLVLRPKKLKQHFLNDYLLNPDFINIVDSSTYGAKMPRASWDFIGNLPIVIPPLGEQHVIAAFLDRETARIDALIEKKQRQIGLLKEKRTTLISHAVTKGLNPNVKMKDSGIEWLGEVPEHWVIIRFKFVLWLQRGHDLPVTEFQEGEYPVCGSNGYIGYHNQFTTKGPGITVGRSGSVGEVNYISMDYWAHNTALYVKEFRRSIPRYAFYLLKTLDVKYLSEGTAVGTLNRNKIHDLPISISPIEEQRSITDFLDNETTKIDALARKVGESIDKLHEYRTALISSAITGKVDIREDAP